MQGMDVMRTAALFFLFIFSYCPLATAAPLEAPDLVSAVIVGSCPGIQGLSLPNLNDKTTWGIWRNGPRIAATVDSCSGPLIQSAIITSALMVPSLSTGIALTSTSNSALNGTYSLDSQSQYNITAVTLYTVLNVKFPGHVDTFPWADMNNVPHPGFAILQFQAFATAVADYVAAIELGEIALTNGQPATWPSSSITIP